MMAGADEPATLSGLCQPMAIAMVRGGTSVHGNGWWQRSLDSSLAVRRYAWETLVWGSSQS